nr:hypothetical protein [Bacilli bacterium]
MIFWSVIPFEIAMEGEEVSSEQEMITVGHRTLYVEPVDATHCRIVRMISPYASDYLHPKMAPGQIVARTELFTPAR